MRIPRGQRELVLTLDFWYMRLVSPVLFSSVIDMRWRPVSNARVAAILWGKRWGGGEDIVDNCSRLRLRTGRVSIVCVADTAIRCEVGWRWVDAVLYRGVRSSMG
jgi:hypothetical protein